MAGFRWNAEQITYFVDAAENSDFFRLLSEHIASALQPTDRVLDAGCGLGYLSFALLPYCKSVTAVDSDPQAIAYLRTRISGKQRIAAACADVFTIPLKFDAIVCCRFGSTEEALRLFDASQARVLILVKRNDPFGRIDGSAVHTRTASEAKQTLSQNGRRFTEAQITLSFDQPFRSQQDALRFFQLYRKNTENDADADMRAERLMQTGDPVFPLRFPITHSLSVLTVYR